MKKLWMNEWYLKNSVKDVACEEWGWFSGRVISFCNIDVTKVPEFGNFIIPRMLSVVEGAEEGSDSYIMTNEISKVPSNRIYIEHHLVTSAIDIEMTN